MALTREQWRENKKNIEYLEGIYGREGLYDLMGRISKLRARGIDVEAELEKEIKRMEQAA